MPDLIKLQPKKDLPKISKAERRKRQKEREDELQNVLALKQAGQISAEDLLKVASEGGEIQAVEPTKSDQRRLARLKAKAATQSVPVKSEAKAFELAEAGQIN